MRCFCPHCGGRIPGRPGQYVRCKHCAGSLLWADDTPFRSASDIHAHYAARAKEEAARSRSEADLAAMLEADARARLDRHAKHQRNRIRRLSRLRRGFRRFMHGLGRRYRQATAPARGFLIHLFPGLAGTLDVDVAQVLITLHTASEPLRLNAVTELSADVAAVLAQHRGDLHLGGLTRLSRDAAQALAAHRGVLHLDGLQTLSEQSAKALATHFRSLSMTSLQPLPPTTAMVLSRYRGAIHVGDENASILKAAARWKAISRKHKSADRGTNAGNRRTHHQMPSHLTADVARTMVRRKGNLRLSGVTSMSVDAAKTLSGFPGDIFLDDMPDLAPEVAEALSAHRGDLYLVALRNLEVPAAEKLARHPGGLEFQTLRRITAAVGDALSGHSAWLSLNGLSELTADVAAALARHNGDLQLNGLRTLSAEVACRLSQHRHWLSLNGLRQLDEEAAKALSRHKGTMLWLAGLTHVEQAALKHLKRIPSVLIPDGVR